MGLPTLTLKHRVEIPIDTLRMTLPADCLIDEDDNPIPLPLLNRGKWTVDVDLATGKIKDWPGGAFDLFVKVRDEGTYRLLASGKEVAAIEENYVPNDLVPGEYGDYVDLKIAADGTIKNWPKHPDLSQFEDE